MNCIVCKNSLKLQGIKQGFNIYRCDNCGMGVTEDLKNEAGNYHRDEAYIGEKELFKNIFLKRVNIILKLSKPGKVLEVGCSTGLLLSLLKSKGWDVLGIEVSKKAAEVAWDRGIEVIVDTFEEANITTKFDLIIFNHTLEHLDDPINVLKKAKSKLSDGGLLYIDLPNFGGLSARVFNLNWPLLLPKEHRWHFTYKSLEILLDDLGFKIIFNNRSSGVWDYNNPFWGIILSFMTLKKRFINEVITSLPSWVISKLNLGSDLMIIAKKL